MMKSIKKLEKRLIIKLKNKNMEYKKGKKIEEIIHDLRGIIGYFDSEKETDLSVIYERVEVVVSELERVLEIN